MQRWIIGLLVILAFCLLWAMLDAEAQRRRCMHKPRHECRRRILRSTLEACEARGERRLERTFVTISSIS